MKLLIGLGNIGKEYEATRHNLGFFVLDRVRQMVSASDFAEQKKFNAFVATTSGKHKIILGKPTTMMNRSGIAVASLTTFYRVTPENIWVIHDDIDLPVGEIRLSFNSRSAGHKGAQSTIDALGTKAFHRVRIGIGRPTDATAVDDFVLRKIPKDEKTIIEKSLEAFFDTVPKLFA